MDSYILFKRSSNKLVFLTPINDSSKIKVAKIVTDDIYKISDDSDGKIVLTLGQCPQIHIGMDLECKNINTMTYEKLGKVIDIQHDINVGFLLVFKN